MNARAVMAWVRANVFIVVFSVIMLAALVALPLVASRMNTSVRDTVESRIAKQRSLESLENTSVEIPQPGGRPPVTENALVNEQTLERYREVVEREKEDADRIAAAALEFNRKGRGVVMPEALPTSRLDPQILGRRWHDAIRDAWADLFTDVRASTARDASDVAAQLRRRERLFLTQTLQKDPSESLTAEEQQRLTEHLADARMGLYAEHANDVGFYLDASAREVPTFDIRRTYGLPELFEQQWRFWIVEDVLQAIADLNGAESVRVAPVKRVVALQVGAAAPPSAGAPAGGGRAPRGGGAQPAVPTPMPIDARTEAPRDYAVSLTGRRSNGLYDVRVVTLDAVVETARLPELVDALARRNFMTVLDMTVEPADQFAAARDGYYYGNEPVSRVVMRVETIWFREWTSTFMPDATKQALGVPTPPPGGPGGEQQG